MGKYYHSNTLDFKNNGKWVLSHNPEPYHKVWTRAGRLWCSINQRLRCATVGNVVYARTTNNFMDFQEFAGWCQAQYGYMNKEGNGKFWSLDKDILNLSSEISTYSKDTCCFVPAIVNCLFTYRKSNKGEYPTGVNFHGKSGKFVAQCNVKGKQIHLGLYNDPSSAHKAWQTYKLQELVRITDISEVREHLFLRVALENWVRLFENQIRNGLETV